MLAELFLVHLEMLRAVLRRDEALSRAPRFVPFVARAA